MKDEPCYTDLLLRIIARNVNTRWNVLIASGGGLKLFVADIAPYVKYDNGEDNYAELSDYLTVLRTQEFARPWTREQVQKIAAALKERSER